MAIDNPRNPDLLSGLMERVYIETITNGVKLQIPDGGGIVLSAQNSLNTTIVSGIIVEIRVTTTMSGKFNIYLQQ
jgi:hypothetical protein